MTINLKTLIGKLNPTCRQAAERAANLCIARGNYEVDIEHLFLALLEIPGCDVSTFARHCGIAASALENDLAAEIARFKTGNSRTPVFSPYLPTLFEHAWLIASLASQTTRIRSAHLLLALLTAPDLAPLAQRGSPLFARFPIEDLKHDLARVTRGSQEASESVALDDDAGDADVARDAKRMPPAGLAKTPALDQFTVNLTQRAKEGKVDPVIGRDAEIRQMIDILMRRRQNNPILTGEAGVGKTAVVEGLALRIAAEDVPRPLVGVALHTLDMGLLQAGASVKGEFENRLKNVIAEVKQSPHPIILFIDEAHTMIGAGGSAGQSDAANLLKPALARGELRTIAATTWAEYKKYFEKDAALARRFQVVKVEEPSEALAAAMLRAMVGLMESHFKIRVMDEAVTEAVRLSHRYVTGRQLPDKAIGVLDTACAKVALAQSSTPARVEDAQKRLDVLAVELAAIEREQASGVSFAAAAMHAPRLAALRAERDAIVVTLAEDRARYDREKTLVMRIEKLRTDLVSRAGNAVPAASTPSTGKKKPKAAAAPDPLRAELHACVEELEALQGETPLVPAQVDGRVVAEIVAAWTGIPLGKMVRNEIATVLNLKPLLAERVLGQAHALEAVAQRVRTARANLEDPNKPKGVFLFVGPSGVGKTETALALAEALYGGERKMITINMSEYQEAHTVSGLKGSPPGYVGYGEGGVLTEAVRRAPYSVVLLDEIEKAHPDVLELFFQVFDKGVLDDAEGREIDFRNTIIILTSNVATQTIMQACLNKTQDEMPDADALTEMIRPQLYKAFKPAFLGRMKTIPFYPISDDVLARIIALKLDRIKKRVAENHKADFSYDPALIASVLARCTEVDSGARNVDHILNGSLLPEIADTVLARMAEGSPIARIKVTMARDGSFKYKVS